MWKEAQNGWKPPLHITEKDFNDLKYQKTRL